MGNAIPKWQPILLFIAIVVTCCVTFVACIGSESVSRSNAREVMGKLEQGMPRAQTYETLNQIGPITISRWPPASFIRGDPTKYQREWVSVYRSWWITTPQLALMLCFDELGNLRDYAPLGED